MGDWNITIQGTGCHHNADYPKDADRMVNRFVQELKDAGHHIHSATFTSGSRHDMNFTAPPKDPTPSPTEPGST